jgi:predicted ATPase
MHLLIAFKGFRDAAIDLSSRPCTLLIGRNGAGKTNAIEGVELLAELAKGTALHEVTDVGGGGVVEVRGGLAGCAPRGAERSFSLGFADEVELTDKRRVQAEYAIKVQVDPKPYIANESLRADGRTIFALRAGTDGVLGFEGSAHLESAMRPLEPDRSYLARYPHDLPVNDPVERSDADLVDILRKHLRWALVFDPEPKAMRGYAPIVNQRLLRNGANLSATLYGLSRGDDDERAALDRIRDAIRGLPEEPFDRFDFDVTALQHVMFGVREAETNELLGANLLSDGTLRCLAVLTSLETARPWSRVVIEEFDNGLHASRVGALSRAVWDVAARHQLNVICTTHNAATLDTLDRTQLEGVVICVWDRRERTSKMIPLYDLPRADVLLERGQLGDLVTRRVLEQYLDPDFEAKQDDAMRRWIESLR